MDHTVNPKRRLRLGMVGGGKDAFIGEIHRFAARLDDEYELLAGALSSNPDKARQSAIELGIPRSYADYQEMAQCESQHTDGIEVVSIVTPNHMHAPVAKAFLERGIHVICDKPLTATLVEAKSLLAVMETTKSQLLLTHNYSAYPMVRQAKAMIENGSLGALRMVHVKYAQDWLTQPLEQTDNKQASWRADPTQAGIGGCIGDIGSHAYQLACFLINSSAKSVLADLTTFVEGRALDDNANLLLRFHNGVKGSLWASQVAPGNNNNLQIEIHGEKAGITWQQERPDQLLLSLLGEPKRVIERGSEYLASSAQHASRIPAGHPEGYLEAFANLYRDFAQQLKTGKVNPLLPNAWTGLQGMQFIAASVESNRRGNQWVDIDSR